MNGWAYTCSDMLAVNGYVKRIVNASCFCSRWPKR